MLTPSQIAEMAAVKYPFITDIDSDREEYFNRLIYGKQQAYIAAFTDAMELMSKEWVSVDLAPKRLKHLDWVLGSKNGVIQNHLFIYHNGAFYSNGAPTPTDIDYFIEKNNILPEPPVLTNDKKI